jgi:hypothetical protein
MQDTDFRLGDSITFEVSNKPYVDRTVIASQNEYRAADLAWIKIYDSCGSIFVDCPMTECTDRIGYYLFRIQTNDQFPVGLYKAVVTLSNTLPAMTTCTSGTSGTSGSPDIITNQASNTSVKYFRIMNEDVL